MANNSHPQQPQLLNVQKAAVFLGVSVKTIRLWAQSRKLKGIKVGTRGDWRFTKDELSKMIHVEKKKFVTIKKFLTEHAEEIQKLAHQNHLVHLGKDNIRQRYIEKYKNGYIKIIREFADNLENLQKGTIVFERLAEKIAKQSLDNGLTLEEAVDGSIFLKQAFWQKLDEEGLLHTLTVKDFYAFSHVITTYSDIVAAKIAFAYHDYFEKYVENRKNADEAAKESEEKYQTLFERMDQGYCIIEMIFDKKNKPVDYRFLEINPVFEKQTGLTNAVGKTALELVPKHEQYWFDIYGKVAVTGKPIRFVNQAKAMNRWYDAYAFRFGNKKSKKVAVLFTDITDRRKIEETIRVNEANLVAAQRLAKMGSWEFDLYRTDDINTNELRWSDETFRIFGFEPGEVTVTNDFFFSLVHPDDRERITKAVAGAIKNKKKYSIEHRIILKDGSERIVHEMGKAIFDKSGKPLKMIGTVQDITEQKVAEENNRYLATLTENISDAVVSTDNEYRIVSWNRGAEKLYGWKAKDVKGKNATEIIVTEFKNSAGRKEWQEALVKQRYWRGEVIQKRKNGTKMDIFASITAIKDKKGNIIGAVAVNRDITERKRADEALRRTQIRYDKLFNSNTIGIFLPGFDGYVHEANDVFLQMIGYSRKDLQAGKVRWDAITPPEYKNLDDEKVKELLTTGEATPWEKEYIRKDGTRVPILLGVVVIEAAANEGLAFAIDISERRRLEKQKDDFMGIASHELKTPVTSVKAYTQVLQHLFARKGDAKSAELLSKMDGQLNKLTSLIADLLDVTKIQGGKLQFNDTYFDFNELVQEIVEEIQRTTEKHTLHIDLAKTKTIYGDRDRIGQVLTNFLTNAIKYSPQANRIIIKTKTDKDTVTLSVQDFGLGISKDKQNKIFERFYRVSGDKEETIPGIGLGLYIASEIIKRQGGKIWVESEGSGKGLPAGRQGSTFSFQLPIAKKKHEKNI